MIRSPYQTWQAHDVFPVMNRKYILLSVFVLNLLLSSIGWLRAGIIEDSLKAKIQERPAPEIQGNTVACEQETSQYWVEVNPNYNYVWSVSPGPHEKTTVYFFTSHIDVTWVGPQGTIVLYTIRGSNLVDRTSLEVEVVNKRAALPNAFSPNQDQMNDRFYVLRPPGFDDILSVDMKIFNREGFMVYQTRDIEEATFERGAWNGANLPPGVYIYQVELELAHCGRHTLRGAVKLIR